MASKIEDIIEEIEEYIDSCKPQAFSSSRIIVNRDEMDALLAELKSKTPEEIKRYQKIIANKEAILSDAQAKADQIIAQAQKKSKEMSNATVEYCDTILARAAESMNKSSQAIEETRKSIRKQQA